MDCLEVISKLCEAVRVLGEIVDKQAEIIERNSIENAAVQDLRLLRSGTENRYRQIVGDDIPTARKDGGEND